MGELALFVAAFAFGVGSAVLPVILNAEAYVIGMGALAHDRPQLAVMIGCLAVGTVIGKAVVFELVRRGSSKVNRSVERRPPKHWLSRRLRRWGDRLLALQSHPYLGAATVFSSALTGVPPLAIVTVIGGASRQPLWLFLLMVGIGRTAQFFAIAFMVHGVIA